MLPLQSGKHEELMAKRGLYYDLVRQQERRPVQDTQENETNTAGGDESSFTASTDRPNMQQG